VDVVGGSPILNVPSWIGPRFYRGVDEIEEPATTVRKKVQKFTTG
jgi:hypothetical protein